MKFSKLITAPNGNLIEFFRTDLQDNDTIVVFDSDCQLERVYKVGSMQLLTDCETPELITSIDQVMDAWESGLIWF